MQTKEEKLALLPVNNITGFFGKTYDYVSTSNINLSADTGANNGTVTVSKNGVALGYVNNFVEENFYFETQIHVNDILATENWPKFGLLVEAANCDILLRNNVGEWYGWIDANASKYGSTAYDFTINEEALLDYWGERLVTVKDFESILPIGIRGVHDNAFECANLDKYEGSTTEEKKVNMLIDVITKQRELIYDIYGTEPQNVPQVYIAYKEANDLYNAGVNEFLAWDGSQDFNGDGIIDWRDNNSDIILMYAEDNQNYLRQTLSETDAQRSGGGGLYYHISYCG